MLTVVEGPTRSLVILRSHYESFILRDTCHLWGENKAVVSNVWLKREEMEALRDRLDQMLNDRVINSPAPPPTSFASRGEPSIHRGGSPSPSSRLPAKSRIETAGS